MAVDQGARHDGGRTGDVLHQRRAVGRDDVAAVAARCNGRPARVKAEGVFIAFHRLVELDDVVLLARRYRIDGERRRAAGQLADVDGEAGQLGIWHRTIDVSVDREQALEAVQHVEIGAQSRIGVACTLPRNWASWTFITTRQVQMVMQMPITNARWSLSRIRSRPRRDCARSERAWFAVKMTALTPVLTLWCIRAALPVQSVAAMITTCAGIVSGFLQFQKAINCRHH